MTDATRKESLLGSGLLYTIATVAPVIVSLLITPLVTRALGAEQYGVVGVSTTLYQFGSIVLGLGLSAAITRHAIIGASGVRGAVALVWMGGTLSLLLGLIIAVLIPLWGPFVLADSHSIGVLVWPVVSSAALSILTLSQSVYRAEGRVKTFVILGMSAALVGPTLGYVFVHFVSAQPGAYMSGLALGHLLAAVISLALLPRTTRSSFTIGDLAENLRIGLPTVPHSVASALLVSTLVVLASHFDGLAAAGQLQLALFLGTAPLLVLGAFNNSWAPMIYRAPESERSDLLSRSMRVVAVLVFWLVGGFTVLSAPVAMFIAGPGIYSGTLVDAALIASIATPLMALYLVNIHLVFISGKTTPLATTSPASLLISIGVVCLAALGSAEDIIALAMGVPLFHFCQAIWSLILRRRATTMSFSITRSVPALALSIATPVAVLLLQPQFWSAAVVIGAVGVILACRDRATIRRLI